MEKAVELEALFAEVHRPLVRALTLVAGDEATASDAVQDAFVQAHRHWRRIRGYDDPAAWIRRTAINRLRNEHRRKGRAERAMSRLGTERAISTADPDERLLLADAVADLPTQQRLAVALHYLADLPVAEVAEALGVAVGTVKSHLHDARRALAERLAAGNEPEVDRGRA